MRNTKRRWIGSIFLISGFLLILLDRINHAPIVSRATALSLPMIALGIGVLLSTIPSLRRLETERVATALTLFGLVLVGIAALAFKTVSAKDNELAPFVALLIFGVPGALFTLIGVGLYLGIQGKVASYETYGDSNEER